MSTRPCSPAAVSGSGFSFQSDRPLLTASPDGKIGGAQPAAAVAGVAASPPPPSQQEQRTTGTLGVAPGTEASARFKYSDAYYPPSSPEEQRGAAAIAAARRGGRPPLAVVLPAQQSGSECGPELSLNGRVSPQVGGRERDVWLLAAACLSDCFCAGFLPGASCLPLCCSLSLDGGVGICPFGAALQPACRP